MKIITYLFNLFIWFILSTFWKSKSKRDEWAKMKPVYSNRPSLIWG